MVLADTSVWVNHLHMGDKKLSVLLHETDVVCHPYIVGELACGNIKNREEILRLLLALPMTSVITQDEFHHFVDSHKLIGLGIGFVDIHLLASSRLAGVPLWTEDKSLQNAADQLELGYTH